VYALLLGLGIGLASGVSPGPLLVLVISSTLRGGWRHGVAVAAAPLLSDLVVVAVVVAVLGQVSESVLSVLGVVGGLVVIGVGVQTIVEGRRASLSVEEGRPALTLRSTLGRSALVNLLSPHPWISWITILGPLAVANWRQSPVSGVLLVVGFYVALVGAKVGIAALVAGSSRWLTDAGYRRALVIAGLALVGLGGVMVFEFGQNLL
jgi:threonine/homoserine/homoserine lactone efflux protein